jgi:phosphotransferase system HPr (HPr) family protein
MTEARVVIRTGVGLHARPAAMLVQAAAACRCKLTLEYAGKKADARSILQVLALGVKDGEEVLIRGEGDGDEAAVASLAGLFAAGAGSGEPPGPPPGRA